MTLGGGVHIPLVQIEKRFQPADLRQLQLTWTRLRRDKKENHR